MALQNKLTDAERRALDRRNPPEMLCDYPGCQNVAIEVMAVVRDLNSKFAVCADHIRRPAQTAKSSPPR